MVTIILNALVRNLLEESTKSCNKLAEYFFIDTFQILKKPYEVVSGSRNVNFFCDYTKLGRALKRQVSGGLCGGLGMGRRRRGGGFGSRVK
ncbi:hypothetical protein JTE90_001305 [Oedothorax gibbosus]|uniref:Uncharacterized protein n=1 Tax=Oedothorax gibbosus TaxID=931172 RepID=A0AAV6TRR1_9ARAC|nr:hypothetical protein JTE90_001305 [Oedothorax gibbosus]